jgi:hypothetical protein
MRLAGTGTRNDCAGEGLQQSTRQTDRAGAVQHGSGRENLVIRSRYQATDT